MGRDVGVLADLQGPKIRIGKFADGKVTLEPRRALHPRRRLRARRRRRASGSTTRNWSHDVKPGDTLLLDDGRIDDATSTGSAAGPSTHACALGGVLSNNKGINRQGGGLSAPALTAKDMEDIRTAARSRRISSRSRFPSKRRHVHGRELMRAAGGKAQLIAKIERVEAIGNLEEILEASDGIMVARGDLAVEVGDAAVPALQKRMIRMAHELNKVAITATQMMESMIQSPVPTRAEVSDVANAVLDGTDAVMLSAETAAGKYPVETVEAMARVCIEAETDAESRWTANSSNRTFTRIDQTIAMARCSPRTTSRSRRSSRSPSRARRRCGCRGSTRRADLRADAGGAARRRMCLYREVHPILFEHRRTTARRCCWRPRSGWSSAAWSRRGTWSSSRSASRSASPAAPTR